MTTAGLFDDGPLWRWWHNGRPDRLYSATMRQPTLDVLELGARPAAWLHKDDGGIYQLTGYHRATMPPELAALIERVRHRTPGSRPHLVVVE